jgi:hypothetical protein
MNGVRATITVGLALAFLLAAAHAVAQAQEPPARAPIPFEAFDQNEDGAISEQEFGEVRAQHMASRAAEGRPMPRPSPTSMRMATGT